MNIIYVSNQTGWFACAINETTDIPFAGQQSIVGIEWTRVKNVAAAVFCDGLIDELDVCLSTAIR